MLPVLLSKYGWSLEKAVLGDKCSPKGRGSTQQGQGPGCRGLPGDCLWWSKWPLCFRAMHLSPRSHSQGSLQLPSAMSRLLRVHPEAEPSHSPWYLPTSSPPKIFSFCFTEKSSNKASILNYLIAGAYQDFCSFLSM